MVPVNSPSVGFSQRRSQREVVIKFQRAQILRNLELMDTKTLTSGNFKPLSMRERERDEA